MTSMNNSLFLSTLKMGFTVLGANAVAIPLLTIRQRFAIGKPSQEEDEGDWPLKKVFMTMFLVFDQKTNMTDEERAISIRKYVDLQRSFTDNFAMFTAFSLAVVALVPNPSPVAVRAVQIFTIARTIHNVLFITYPVQPFRAIAYVSTLLANVALIYELYTNM